MNIVPGLAESWEKIDDYTVEIVTKDGFGPLLSHLSHPGAVILNEKAVKNMIKTQLEQDHIFLING